MGKRMNERRRMREGALCIFYQKLIFIGFSSYLYFVCFCKHTHTTGGMTGMKTKMRGL